MSYVILVPLLPLLAALVIGVAGRSLRERSAKVGGAAVVAAFLGALVTLVAVSSNGPISVRFYEPASGTSLGFPVGFYIDRLSAVMMVLISGVSTIIYLFSMRYMQQERGYSRFLALLAFTTFVLLCMVSSANLLMLFIFWQLLTWLLYLLSHHYAHPAKMEGAFKTYTLLRVGDVAFLSGIVLASGLRHRRAHGAAGSGHDADPERHQKNAGLLHYRADGLYDHGVRAGGLRPGGFSSDRARSVQGHDLPQLRPCDPCGSPGTEAPSQRRNRGADGLFAPDLAHRIYHDAHPPPDHSAGRPRRLEPPL